MSKSFHLSISENVRSIREWHTKKHPGEWCDCVWEPCSVTEPEFRKVWS